MSYPYVNKPLTVESATDIISRLHSLYSDFPYNIDKTKWNIVAKKVLWADNSNELYIVEIHMLTIFVEIIHQALGGKWPIQIHDTRITKKALTRLSENGKARQISESESEEVSLLELANGVQPRQISEEKWWIPPACQQIWGKGEGWVYLYYFDREKAEAQNQGNEVWPCKIGRTEREPEKRIQEQIDEDSDIPIIALLLRTDKPKVLERTIHGILTLRDVHLKHGQGKEWFLTSPNEVIDIYCLIVDKKPAAN